MFVMLSALSAIDFLLLFVDFDMLVQIRFLSESLWAPRILTLKGALLGVHSQMIEKVVPLPEKHAASEVFAFEDFHETLGLRILVLIYFKFTGSWDSLVYLEWIWIELVTSYNLDSWHCIRDLSPDLFIADIFACYYFCLLLTAGHHHRVSVCRRRFFTIYI